LPGPGISRHLGQMGELLSQHKPAVSSKRYQGVKANSALDIAVKAKLCALAIFSRYQGAKSKTLRSWLSGAFRPLARRLLCRGTPARRGGTNRALRLRLGTVCPALLSPASFLLRALSSSPRSPSLIVPRLRYTVTSWCAIPTVWSCFSPVDMWWRHRRIHATSISSSCAGRTRTSWSASSRIRYSTEKRSPVAAGGFLKALDHSPISLQSPA
jgi:hypothetical protein